jgi:hypothetical protein
MAYNTSFICTYKLGTEFDDDERNILYQIQLLEALNIRIDNMINVNIDESILDNRINELYEKLKNHPTIIQILGKSKYYEDYKENPLVLFKMFFSYDEFDKFHKTLCSIMNNRNFSD